jgi:hypothetical protein
MAYELAWTGAGQDGKRFCLGLIDLADLGRQSAAAALLPVARAADAAPSPSMMYGIPVAEAPHSGAIRPAFGPDSGVIRGADHAPSRGEIRSFASGSAEAAEKALPETVPPARRTGGAV